MVQYSYRAENADSYGFEAYLEFSIADSEQFWEHIGTIAPKDSWKEFPYCEGYWEYSIADSMRIWLNSDQEGLPDPHYQIEWADIRKVLYSPEEQVLIYTALGVSDGGSADTEYLGVFFERFGIDPPEYAGATMTH